MTAVKSCRLFLALFALMFVSSWHSARAADVICYNCPPEWADWATMNKSIKADLGIDMPHDNKNSGQALAQILANLLSNAEKYAARGTVEIASAWREGTLTVRVSDEGPGVPAEAAERIFQPFERLDCRVDEGVTGAGLGLAIARELTGQMGGTLRLPIIYVTHDMSEVEQLADHLVLMTAGDGAQGGDVRTAGRRAGDSHRRRAGCCHMKLLIADDDPITRDALRACLEGEGFIVLPAKDGAEALELWERHRPDLLCLDIMMPRVDGYGVCRRVRAADARVPVLFLSAKNEEIDVVVGLQLGADDFIRKPFGKHELLARIRTALRRTEASAGNSRRFAIRDLVVWPGELRAERGGVPIELSPRETAILTVLHERIGQVVDRDTLLNRCWGLDYFPESRTLDQHIAKLRKRVETKPEDLLIETVRGVGYRCRAG